MQSDHIPQITVAPPAVELRKEVQQKNGSYRTVSQGFRHATISTDVKHGKLPQGETRSFMHHYQDCGAQIVSRQLNASLIQPVILLVFQVLYIQSLLNSIKSFEYTKTIKIYYLLY